MLKMLKKRNKEKLIEVKWFKDVKHLSEIYQKTGMLFAFVTYSEEKETYIACHQWVKCRDFLPDAVRAFATKTPCIIYGFEYNRELNPPIDIEHMRMLVSKQVLSKEGLPDFKDTIVSATMLLNHFEKENGIALTKVQEISTNGSKQKAIYMFTGSPVWVQSPFMVSLYTFLIRLGEKKIKFKDKKELLAVFKKIVNNKTDNDNDSMYLRKMWDKLHTVVANRNILFPKKNKLHDINFKDYTINNFHNHTGIKSLVECSTPDKKLNKRVIEAFNIKK